MSTRGAVGFGTVESWRGVYNHADSGPTRLGPALWRVLTRELEDLPALRDRLFRAGRVEEFLAGTVASEQRMTTVSSETIDPLFIQCIYIVELGPAPLLHVGGSVPLPPKYFRSGFEYVIATFPLHGPEPDWRAFERSVTRRMAPAILERMRELMDDATYESARRRFLEEYGDESE